MHGINITHCCIAPENAVTEEGQRLHVGVT